MNFLSKILTAMPIVGVLASSHGSAASAASFVTVFAPSITVQATCNIGFLSRRMNFGRQGLLNANINRRRRIEINCTAGTNFNIGFDGGTTPGGSVATRKMVKGSETVDYNIYQDSARTVIWGDTIGTDTVASTGTGATQTFRIYGQVPPQPTPSPGRYRDVLTVTVTY